MTSKLSGTAMQKIALGLLLAFALIAISPFASSAALPSNVSQEGGDGGGGGTGGGGGGGATTQCNDGVDNDSNTKTDYPADLGCTSATDTTESGYTPAAQCADGVDNDSNGLIDTNDQGCSSATDTSESGYVTQCGDSIDNDGNGKTDYPADLGCSAKGDATEAGYTPPPTPPPGVEVYKTKSKRDFLGKVYLDQRANGGVNEKTAAHGRPQYPSNVVSPTGTRICSLYDPTSFITAWSLGGFDNPGNDSMAAWNPTTGKWFVRSANSFQNSRYNYLTCRTNATPDTSLTGTANGTTATELTVEAGTPVTLTWASQYGQIRKGTMSATNFGLTATIPGHWETVLDFSCVDGNDDGFNDSYNIVSAPNANQTAAAGGMGCWGAEQVWVPESTSSRPFGGSNIVTPMETTTYTYTGTNANGSSSSSVTVTVIPSDGDDLTVSCVASPSPSDTGDSVIWTANASGGETTSGEPSSSGIWQETGESYTKVCSAGNNIQQPSCDGGQIAGESCSAIGSTCKDHAYNLPGGCDSPSGDESAGPTVYSEVTVYTCVASEEEGEPTGPEYTYSWSGTDSLSGSGSTVSKTYATTGTKSATVTVTSGDLQGTAQCSVEVATATNECTDGEDNDDDGDTDAQDPGCQGGDGNGPESNSPTLSCDVNDSSVTETDSVTYTADVDPSGSYTYDWNPLDGQTCTGTGASRNCTFPGTGNYRMSLTTDGDAELSCNFTTVEVGEACVPSSVTITASADRVKKGTPVDFTWTASEGCTCEITGPGGFYSNERNGSTQVTITKQTKFETTCSGTSKSVTVNPVGLFNEF